MSDLLDRLFGPDDPTVTERDVWCPPGALGGPHIAPLRDRTQVLDDGRECWEHIAEQDTLHAHRTRELRHRNGW